MVKFVPLLICALVAHVIASLSGTAFLDDFSSGEGIFTLLDENIENMDWSKNELR
jgi:hypothetical protein